MRTKEQVQRLLKQWLAETDTSVKQLADVLNVSASSIYYWISGGAVINNRAYKILEGLMRSWRPHKVLENMSKEEKEAYYKGADIYEEE